jgi:hypothetical protein
MLCECVVCELTSWVEFILFVFRRSRDRSDRPNRGGPTARVLKRPNRPEPVMGPRPSAVFFSSFSPPAYYLGSLNDLRAYGNFPLCEGDTDDIWLPIAEGHLSGLDV